MERKKNIFFKTAVFSIVVTYFISSIPALAETTQKESIICTNNKTTPLHSSLDGVELKYYNEEGLSVALGIGTSELVIWKSAIRLTQVELTPYTTWTMTRVNVAFYRESGYPSIDVRIYIYDKGTTTQPGSLLVNDTTYTLNTTGITTIPLVTPVVLYGHEELWVAVEWRQESDHPIGWYYAWMDTETGPHVEHKSDFVYLNSAWAELHHLNPSADGSWGIGAIVSNDFALLTIDDVAGPLGITAAIKSIGTIDATNVLWSIRVTGGILKRVNESNTGGPIATLAPDTTTPVKLDPFFGLGKINIVISAVADNTMPVTIEKSAFLLGPFVVSIKDA